MQSTVLFLAILAASLLVAAYNAWRIGCDKRDIAAMAGAGGLCVGGTAVVALM